MKYLTRQDASHDLSRAREARGRACTPLVERHHSIGLSGQTGRGACSAVVALSTRQRARKSCRARPPPRVPRFAGAGCGGGQSEPASGTCGVCASPLQGCRDRTERAQKRPRNTRREGGVPTYSTRAMTLWRVVWESPPATRVRRGLRGRPRPVGRHPRPRWMLPPGRELTTPNYKVCRERERVCVG